MFPRISRIPPTPHPSQPTRETRETGKNKRGNDSSQRSSKFLLSWCPASYWHFYILLYISESWKRLFSRIYWPLVSCVAPPMEGTHKQTKGGEQEDHSFLVPGSGSDRGRWLLVAMSSCSFCEHTASWLPISVIQTEGLWQPLSQSGNLRKPCAPPASGVRVTFSSYWYQGILSFPFFGSSSI